MGEFADLRVDFLNMGAFRRNTLCRCRFKERHFVTALRFQGFIIGGNIHQVRIDGFGCTLAGADGCNDGAGAVSDVASSENAWFIGQQGGLVDDDIAPFGLDIRTFQPAQVGILSDTRHDMVGTNGNRRNGLGVGCIAGTFEFDPVVRENAGWCPEFDQFNTFCQCQFDFMRIGGHLRAIASIPHLDLGCALTECGHGNVDRCIAATDDDDVRADLWILAGTDS